VRKTNIILEPLGCLYLFIFNLLSGLLPNIAPALTAAGSESFGQKLSEAGGDSTGTHPKRERMNENEHVFQETLPAADCYQSGKASQGEPLGY